VLGWLLVGVVVGCGAMVPAAYWYHRRTLRRAAALEARARESQRLAFVGALASGLAHEVKNPLSTLRLNLRLLEEDLAESGQPGASRMQSRLQVLCQEVERLNDVLNDYLRFARQHQLHPQPANLNDVLEEILEFVRPEALRRNVQLRHRFAANLPQAQLDVNLLKQALLNLIVNAFEAMPDGGEIIVETACDGTSMTTRVTDTGSGIPPEDLDNVFRVYYSTKRTGTGLGLPTARRIIQEHGGSLELQSEPGRGTQVTVALPVRGATQVQSIPPAQRVE